MTKESDGEGVLGARHREAGMPPAGRRAKGPIHKMHKNAQYPENCRLFPASRRRGEGAHM